MKKAFSCLAALILILCFSAPALAAEDAADKAAQALYELGLFRGTGTNPDGTPVFDLHKTPTRNQAIIMLVRLLGKEQEALSGSWELPFTDVSEDSTAYPYIGYAYANGLTKGYTKTTFRGSIPIRSNQYITFVLRALGYESGKDFSVGTAWTLSDQLGITDQQYNAANAESFLRGDVAQISANALSAVIKDTTQTLREKLMESGALREEDPSLRKQDLAPADLIFQPIPAKYHYRWSNVPLKDFELLSAEYAEHENDVYFRVHYRGNFLRKFFVMPANMFHDELGNVERYAAPVSGGVFTCKVEKSAFKKYTQLVISPSEDGQSGPDYVIEVGYLMLTDDGSPADFVPVEDYIDDSYEVADFRFHSVEYAEVLGGRLYRIHFTNDAYRNIQFWTLKHGQTSSFDTRLMQVVFPQAGDTSAMYFVPDFALAEYEYIYVRVRDAFSINPTGGNMQTHSGIDIYFDRIPDWRK